MGKVYSHLSEEERQVIQIEVGNGTSVRKIARLLGRGPSGISREIRRNTWFPSNESESYRPYRPKRLKTGPWTGRYYIAGPAQLQIRLRDFRTIKRTLNHSQPLFGDTARFRPGHEKRPRIRAAAPDTPLRPKQSTACLAKQPDGWQRRARAKQLCAVRSRAPADRTACPHQAYVSGLLLMLADCSVAQHTPPPPVAAPAAPGQ